MNQVFGSALVLLVDPDPDTREMYRRAFEIAGYRAVEAESLAAALALGDGDPPDVALCEWRLPDGDGLELAHRLRGRPATRESTLVAVTGTSLAGDQERLALTHGFERVLLKPALPELVVDVVQDIVRVNAVKRLRAAALQTARLAALVSPPAGEGMPHSDLFDKAASIIDRAAARICGPVALVLADDRGRYLAASDGASELTGYPREALLSRSVFDVTPTPQLEAGLRQWADFIAAGTQEGTYELERADGSRVLVQFYAVANVVPGLHVSAICLAPGSITRPSVQ